MAIGFRIGAARPRVDTALVARFAKIPVACVSDSMHRLTAGGARIRPMGASRMAGPAFVVKTAPGDNLMVHKAIAMAEPGDIVVCDAGGDLTNAIIGDRMLTVAHAKGLAGIIINGAVRDADTLKGHEFPVFAAGITHRGPYKNGPGEINYPIAIDGMVIESGDLIVADDDGFLCIPIRDAAEVCDAAERKFAHETSTPPGAYGGDAKSDDYLRKLGCGFPDE
ncbi:RraA family protein [uncultured Paracoccus sp.]|uniref:RraA family protein n=1 Tax=uncultured Paracoccus sp. TaxID=189685 RepID=UPI0025EB28B6|nr:RraA family protein [uncultured Paracoccus sp.]